MRWHLFCRVILWRRNDNFVFALITSGSAIVNIGDGVECKVTGILQVVDEVDGPSTKKEYEAAMAPVGDELKGQVVDFLGRPVGIDGKPSDQSIGIDKMAPLFGTPPCMEDREPIDSPLLTGVKALDIITPLGKGQALQISGIQGSGKTEISIESIMGQQDTGIRCVYAAVGCSRFQLSQTLKHLSETGCMGYTTVVVATDDKDLGEQYAAISYSMSIAERIRDEGGDALVVLNDVGAMVRLWESITVSMASLGSVAVEVLEDELPDTPSSTESDDLVEYEGMLVSVAAAQRRRFFSSLIQRCARMHRRLRGGSLTGLFVVPGCPSQGTKPHIKEKIAQYKHLSPAQKEKLMHALEQQSDPLAMSEPTSPQDLRTEIVEEFMSMTDGQVVLYGTRDQSTGGARIDPQLSVSRIGGRAYSPAISEIASLVRFELAQANDAQKFAANAATDPMTRKALKRAAVVTAALPQPVGTICPLEHQVVQLMAVQQGLFDDIPPAHVAKLLREITSEVSNLCPKALSEVARTRKLSRASKAAILAALNTSCKDILGRK